MSRRTYVSAVRTGAAAEKRQRVVEAAARFLRGEESLASLSLDAVARAAGVTRLTVYNQFGSRRGLLEAVFDTVAGRGGLQRLAMAMADPDPWHGLDEVVATFCAFWASDPAIGRLHDATAMDPELAQAVASRNERRRHLLGTLIARIAEETVPARIQRDAVDMIFALTSQAMFRQLAPDRDPEAVCALLRTAVRDAVTRMNGQGDAAQTTGTNESR